LKEDAMYTLYGAKGWGSTIAEAVLDVAGLPYRVEDVMVVEAGPGRDRLLALNPLGQVPTLVMPDGSIMTESAAIVLHVNDLAPAAGLVPPPGDPLRPAFLRWLVFLVAQVYPTFTYFDFPERWVGGEAAQADLKERLGEYRKRLWRQVEGAAASPWFLGERFSALDVYVCAMTHWQPRRAWFAAECPKLTQIATKADAEPRLARVLKRNFG
jgi:GST-like protein